MDQEEDLTFYLRQQQTIELIVQDKIEEALEYAETHLAPLTQGRPDLHDEMGESFSPALVSYQQRQESFYVMTIPSDQSFGLFRITGSLDCTHSGDCRHLYKVTHPHSQGGTLHSPHHYMHYMCHQESHTQNWFLCREYSGPAGLEKHSR